MFSLDQKLHQIDTIEHQQLKNGQDFNELNINYTQSNTPKLPEAQFFSEGNIYILKHHRFAYTAAHTHNFIELNYMYSGQCQQNINGQHITLQEHQLLMMDQGVTHSLDYTNEQDILINILIQDSSIMADILTNLSHSNDLITNFIMTASKKAATHNDFIIFDISQNTIARNLINSLIEKNYQHTKFKGRSMNLILSAFLTELSNSKKIQASGLPKKKNDFLKVLQYIDEHYTNTNLTTVAKYFGYNSNYLSNKIKLETGHTFQALIEQKRLVESQKLLIESTQTITTIANQMGYQNAAPLFRIYKKHLQLTPEMYRQKYTDKA
ncbi:AraC family transcriptional regulator [Lactobacillus curvatus] [Lactiplantibacillus mudanjiangensis]|uniref:AraC family transcriptional regulator n=1 Tax=Lactiplantibacillus mudanjiangensis TaxID=1296538 RepID=UPI001014BAD9|nr:AraC family transcriptional regulator [Lactiplantibacillus mudanjiangensis]VDG20802.1 AraC family transcriptional regulator [Lactobacillus curvatus] [Lactiplantibacillus mudanjiangensis]VDG32069.1 AraC family transcriptional regulator [Lactobacillus curvatus] [Lactiplantibacillus mudanjiangensis]